ncbi:MAG: FecR domain-containing protein [Spirochaetota bacterium]
MKLPAGKMRIQGWLSLLFLCAVLVPLSAQIDENSETDAGSLIYASGSGFEIVRNGSKEEYDLSTDIVDGLEFRAGDYVNTFDGTFLEIQISGSTNVLKISENTSFEFDQSARTNTSQYEVSYGRVRARVRKLAGLEQFAISGPSMVAGVRGTDFGYDVLYDVEEQSTIASVYCFEGKVEVEPTVQVIEEAEQGELEADAVPRKMAPIEIEADEMVQVRELTANQLAAAGRETGDAEQLFTLRRTNVDEEIRSFWKENDFKALPVELESETETEQEGQVETAKESETAEPPPGLQFKFTQSQLRRGSLLTAGIGTVFGAAALTFAYADPLVGDMDPAVRDNLTLSMGISAGLFFSTSLFTLIASLF